METLGIRVVVDPAAAALALGFVAAGIALGTLSGLTPGLHVNTIAVVLGAVASDVPGPPHLVGAAMLAAGITHSFLDVVPTLAIGVPDAAMSVSALPGHRLVLGGRGREALRLSAVGSASAILVAGVLGLPVTVAMRALVPLIDRFFPLLVGGVVAVLLVTEPDSRGRIGGMFALAASGLLGVLTLDAPTAGLAPGGGTLLPLLSGLFGVPVLVHAASGAGVPPQGDTTISGTRPRTLGWGSVGAIAGAVVAYVPGISAAVAAALAFAVVPRETGARGFITTVSGVNTANAVFALFALVAVGTPRTGVLVAFERARLPPNLPLLLAAVGMAAAVSFVLVPVIGDRYLRVVGAIDPERLTVGVGALLVLLVAVFTGPIGVAILGVASLVGMIPPAYGARRVHLMGVLFVPLAIRSLTG
ncbi:MAG: tripartite tricarboxylate transporter permease [Halanaeroarchaeum sp.]